MNLDQELRDVLAERAERGQPPPPNIDALMAGGLARRRRRRRVVVATAGLAALVAIAAGVAVGRGLLDTRADGPVDRPPSHVDEPATELPYLLDVNTRQRTPAPEALAMLDARSDQVSGWPWWSVFSADAEKFAYSTWTCSSTGCEPDAALLVTNADGTDPVELQAPGDETDVALPLAWSPDSTTLLYQVKSGISGDLGDLFIHHLDSGRTTQLTHHMDRHAWSISLDADFSPDGTTVLYHLPRFGDKCSPYDVWSVPVTGGDPTLVLRNAANPRYLADGERIAFLKPKACAEPSNAIWVAAEGSRRPLMHMSPVDPPDRLEMSPDRTKIMYTSAGEVFLVDVATGETTRIDDGNIAIWVDNDTLLMPGSDRPH